MSDYLSSVDIIATQTTRVVIGLEPGQPIYRVLVAEDLRENRQLLVRLLESVGFEVCATENGKEAIALWSEWHPPPDFNGHLNARDGWLRDYPANSRE